MDIVGERAIRRGYREKRELVRGRGEAREEREGGRRGSSGREGYSGREGERLKLERGL